MDKALPLISTCFIVISAILVAIGWYQIIRGRREKHQSYMLAGAVFALLFFIIYMSRTIFVGNTALSESAPEWVQDAYYVFLLFHILLAAVSAVFGIVTLLLAFRKAFARHRKWGKWTAALWLCTAPTGVMVYVILYELYPGGHTKPVLDVILGG